MVQAIPVGSGPSAVAVGEGAVWVVNRQLGTLARIDPERNAVTWSGAVGSDPTAVAVGEGAVWVAGGEDGTVVQVDPDGPRVVEPLKTGSSPAAIAVAGGSVWAAADAPQVCAPGWDAPRARPQLAQAALRLDWLDPRAINGWAAFSLDSLAYDGLVAYRRVEGPAGATIVGALATTAPPASHDGLSYVFTLRRGLRYSDGTPVRPADFRGSMERFLQATRDLPADQQLPPLYAGIVGAPRCMAANDRCDLSRGIEADARTRTITIHLTRPDPEFLHKLTIPFASVVPAGSPARATRAARRPAPGPTVSPPGIRGEAGPSSATRISVSGPARSRGPGFADRIEVVLDDYRKIEQQIAATQRGTADVAILADPFGSDLSPLASGAGGAGAGTALQHAGGEFRMDLPQRATPPVRRPPRAARGQLRDRPGQGRRARRRTRGRPTQLPDPAARFPGPRALLPLHREAGRSRLVCA